MRDDVYVRLQRHLNRQAVGFPATKSGSEIRILKHIFSPLQAGIAACLTYRPEPLETVYQRAAHLVQSKEALEDLLDRMEMNGGLELKILGGRKFYCNAPLVVGMYEYQLGRLTPEFIEDFEDYTSSRQFGAAFLGTKLPQMRTIPIAKSIQPKHHVSIFDEVSALLRDAEPPFAIFECICRHKQALKGKPCKVTDRKETCFAAGSFAQAALRSGIGRKITRAESLAVFEQNQKQGLVLQPSNTEKAEFICSCCGCCCGMLGMHKALPIPVDFWASNFYAVIDADQCNGCGSCEKRCQVGAATLSAKSRKASIDLNRCIGCGLCVPVCPQKALSLEKKHKEVRPPGTREDLMEIIMAHKKGTMGKLGLAGKLLIDAIRTGQTRLFK